MAEKPEKSWLARIPLVGQRIADRIERVPTVAVLRLAGVIGQLGPVRRGGLTLADQAETIQKAFDMPRIKAVALAVNSPGGSPVQSALIAGRIRALAEEKELPVYAFCEDVILAFLRRRRDLRERGIDRRLYRRDLGEFRFSRDDGQAGDRAARLYRR